MSYPKVPHPLIQPIIYLEYLERNYVCAEYVQIFFLFPKQCGIIIYIVLTFYEALYIIERWYKAYRRMCVGSVQTLPCLLYVGL